MKVEPTLPVLSSSSPSSIVNQINHNLVQNLDHKNDIKSDSIKDNLIYNCSKSIDGINNHFSFIAPSKLSLKANQMMQHLNSNLNYNLSQSASFSTASHLASICKSKSVTKPIKGSSLKRVSFGSSKGSMVETLFYNHKDNQQNVEPKTNSSVDNLDKGISNYSTRYQPQHFHYPYFRKLGYRVASDSTISSDTSKQPFKVQVSLTDSVQPITLNPAKVVFDTPYSSLYSIQLTPPSFKLRPLSLPVRRIESMEQQTSLDLETENPFRPGGELSREADNIIRLIRAGKPITPTSFTKDLNNHVLNGSSNNFDNKKNLNASESTTSYFSPSKLSNKPQTKSPEIGKNQVNVKLKPGVVQVERSTVPKTEAPQTDVVNIKKKSKCKCCVVQ